MPCAIQIESKPLAERVGPGDKVVVTHSDITRPVPNDRILPVILEELEQAGVHREDITLLNALGTHRQQSDDELRMMLGDAIVNRYPLPATQCFRRCRPCAVGHDVPRQSGSA